MICYQLNEVGLPNCILLFRVHFYDDFTSLHIKGIDIQDKITDEVGTVRNFHLEINKYA
jgi:hypothetical protein